MIFSHPELRRTQRMPALAADAKSSLPKCMANCPPCRFRQLHAVLICADPPEEAAATGCVAITALGLPAWRAF
jgi:hypothetical protein